MSDRQAPDFSPPMLSEAISRAWLGPIREQLEQYIRIPAKSPDFDPQWAANGHIDAALTLIADWCLSQSVVGMKVEICRLPGRTPLLCVEVPGERPGHVLIYGHMDKQPEFSGWSPGLGPWTPVIRDGRLYGRGGADDGYAAFSALTAISALKAQRQPMPRCTLLIEASEESGSPDLSAYLAMLADRLGEVSLIIALDSESGDYARLWNTTSLRGNLTGKLSVRVLREGVHSGMGSGIAPTCFRILQQLLERLEDPTTGHSRLSSVAVPVPPQRTQQIADVASILGESVAAKMPWAEGARAIAADPVELLLNNTWRAALAVTGADGLPPVADAGNVLLPAIAVKLSLRLPPSCDAEAARSEMIERLTRDPPFGAQVTFHADPASYGWDAPPLAPWLAAAMQSASLSVFGQGAAHWGCGGTIPFLRSLAERYPKAQFFVTGVLGPHSNAHGPNEFLDLAYARRITECVSWVLAAAR